MALKLCLIVAACENMGIGSKGELPWKLRKEMAYFSRMTRGVEKSGKVNAVVMGRKTWNSIPPKFRPLPDRLNLVLTRNQAANNELSGAIPCETWEKAVEELQKEAVKEQLDKVWIIGGSSVYQTAMESPFCHRIYLTRILRNFECDVVFPAIDSSKYKRVQDPQVPDSEEEEDGVKYRYEVYERIP